MLTMAEQKRDDISVKLDRQVAQLAKAAAALDDMNLAEWLSAVVRPIAEKRLAKPTTKKKEVDDGR